MLAQPLVAFWSGDWEQAGAIWAAARERHRRAGNRWGVADFACRLAQLRHIQGDTPGAARAFEEALAIAVEAPIVPIEVQARTGLAVLAAEQGEQQAARSHLTRCAEILAEGEDWRGLAGRVALAEAVALAAEGDHASADTRFTDATRLFRHYALRWDEAGVLYWWGRALGRAGRAAEASDKLDAAVGIYEGSGAGAVWIERVLSARLPRGGGHVAHPRRPGALRPPTYPDGLSEREVQVVRLIAAGKSNREIAEALVISRHTVERHVNHILAKTGASNRTQVAGYAHRHLLEA
jgi:DNA-binding CsgD family transcriptional regulator